MIFNMTGGGKKDSLNFEVTAYPSEVELNTSIPTDTTITTIGVVTTNPINGWYFASAQPENMAEGEVWIYTGTSCTVEFNALKENSVMVYPLKAKQMVSGALKDVTAKSYQNGEWVDWWNGVLLEPDNQYTVYTGGWVADARLSPWKAATRADTAPTAVKSSSGLSVIITMPSTHKKGCYRTVNKVNLTDYNKLVFDVGSANGSNGAVLVGCIDKLDVAFSGDAAAIATVVASSTLDGGVKSLDISALTGEYYIAVTLCSYEKSDSTSVNVKKVYLE